MNENTNTANINNNTAANNTEKRVVMMRLTDGSIVEVADFHAGEPFADVIFEGNRYRLLKKHLKDTVNVRPKAKGSNWYDQVCQNAAAGMEYAGKVYHFGKVLNERGTLHKMDYCNGKSCPSHLAFTHATEKGLRPPQGSALVFVAKEDPTVKLYACARCRHQEIVKEQPAKSEQVVNQGPPVVEKPATKKTKKTASKKQAKAAKQSEAVDAPF